MKKTLQRFTVGEFECTVLLDSFSPLYLPELIPQVDNDEAKAMFATYGVPFPATLDINCLVLRTGARTLLLDTGWGPDWTACPGELMQRLAEAGIAAGDIDTVVLSHAHPDHIGGNLAADGTPAFPNARYLLGKSEWDYWTAQKPSGEQTDPIQKEMMAVFEKSILRIQDRLDIIDDEAEVMPGLTFVPTPGHTAGHTSFLLSSKGETLFCINDAAHNPVLMMRPRLTMAFDTYPEQGAETRLKMLDYLSSTGMLVFSCHLLFPGLGHCEKVEDEVWAWRPLSE